MFPILAFLFSVTSATLHESIPMIDIDALTLVAGRMTAARRSGAVPQLECTGSYCTNDLMPTVVQCRNVGSDGKEVQWRCDAELSTQVKFGRIEVSCEGFEFAGDRNVLVGSCGLQYELLATANHQRYRGGDNGGDRVHIGEVIAIVTVLVLVGFAVCVVTLYCLHATSPNPSPPPYSQAPPVVVAQPPTIIYSNSGWGWGGWGWGWGGGSSWGRSSWGGGGSSWGRSSSSGGWSRMASGFGGSRSR